MEERIKLIMKNLECSREEAIQVIKDDEAIDKGEKMFELSKEQKKASKQARSTGTKAETERKPRERKVDNTKRDLINKIAAAIEVFEQVESIEITNAEREINFVCGGRKFKVVLSAPRK